VQFSKLYKLSDFILTLDWDKVTLLRIVGLPTFQIRSKSEKPFVDGCTYEWRDGHTWVL